MPTWRRTAVGTILAHPYCCCSTRIICGKALVKGCLRACSNRYTHFLHKSMKLHRLMERNKHTSISQPPNSPSSPFTLKALLQVRRRTRTSDRVLGVTCATPLSRGRPQDIAPRPSLHTSASLKVITNHGKRALTHTSRARSHIYICLWSRPPTMKGTLSALLGVRYCSTQRKETMWRNSSSAWSSTTVSTAHTKSLSDWPASSRSMTDGFSSGDGKHARSARDSTQL